MAASHEPDARYFNVNQIILENDLVVASIGRKVFAWKAGTGKGRTKGDSHRKVSGQKTESKGTLKPLGKSSSPASGGALRQAGVERMTRLTVDRQEGIEAGKPGYSS